MFDTPQIPHSLPDFWPETFILEHRKCEIRADNNSSLLSYLQVLPWAEERRLPNVIPLPSDNPCVITSWVGGKRSLSFAPLCYNSEGPFRF